MSGYVFDTYIIDFDRPYKKGEIIEAVVEWDLEGKGFPFVSAQIQNPTNKLILSVEFDRQLEIKDIEFEETFTIFSKIIPKKHSKLTLKNNCVSKTVSNPKLLHLYTLRWKW